MLGRWAQGVASGGQARERWVQILRGRKAGCSQRPRRSRTSPARSILTHKQMWKEDGGEGQESCECLFSWSHSHGVEKVNSDCFPTWRFVENKVPVETVVRCLSLVVGPCSAKPRCLDGAGCQEPLLAAKNHRWLPTPLTGSWTIVASTTVEFNQILPGHRASLRPRTTP